MPQSCISLALPLPETYVLRSWYRQLYRIRRVEEVIAELYPRQEMGCPVHLCIGQEAVAVGVCSELGPDDQVFSTHRSHGHYLARGGSLPALLAELHGKATSCSKGKGGSIPLIDPPAGFPGSAPILGATVALAVGAAFGTRLRGEQLVTVAFFGDGDAEEGIFCESAKFAALKRLPVLLVCANNGLSTHTRPRERQPAGRTLCDVARGIGLAAATGDGNDVQEVATLARRAVQQARDEGPVFLELHTYLWREHCGPNEDVHLGYRSRAELTAWQERCPLRRLEEHMIAAGIWDDADIARLACEVEQEIEEAVDFARASPSFYE